MSGPFSGFGISSNLKLDNFLTSTDPYYKKINAIRLTVAKYYLPSGKSISEVGVSPDIEVAEEGNNFRIKTETDNQLNYAIKLLNG